MAMAHPRPLASPKPKQPKKRQQKRSGSPVQRILYGFLECGWVEQRKQVWQWLKWYLDKFRPHVLCLNETKKSKDDLTALFAAIQSQYDAIINSHKPSNMHGVAVLVRKDVPWRRLEGKLNCKRRSDTHASETAAACGRLIAVEVGSAPYQFHVVATYSPNSGVGYPPLKNLPYRLGEWDPALYALLEEMRQQKPTLWIGDINVAPEDMDVSHPTRMVKQAGFTPQERQSLRDFLAKGQWHDVWRKQHPKLKAYTYRGKPAKWSPNYGMRSRQLHRQRLVARACGGEFHGARLHGTHRSHSLGCPIEILECS